MGTAFEAAQIKIRDERIRVLAASEAELLREVKSLRARADNAETLARRMYEAISAASICYGRRNYEEFIALMRDYASTTTAAACARRAGPSPYARPSTPPSAPADAVGLGVANSRKEVYSMFAKALSGRRWFW